MKRKEREGERNKTQKNHMRHNPVAHHLLNIAHPIPEHRLPLLVSPPIYLLSMTASEHPPWFLSEHLRYSPFIKLSLTVLCWPCFLNGILCTSSLAERGKSKSTELRVSTTKQQLKHQCILNIILKSHPKHSSVPVTKKKIGYLSQIPNSLSLCS